MQQGCPGNLGFAVKWLSLSHEIKWNGACRALVHEIHFSSLSLLASLTFVLSLASDLYPVWKDLMCSSGEHRDKGITHNDSFRLSINESRRWQGPFMTKTEIFSTPHPTPALNCFVNLLGTTWKTRLITVCTLPGNITTQRLLHFWGLLAFGLLACCVSLDVDLYTWRSWLCCSLNFPLVLSKVQT